jgi:molybdenum cofactor guanylyltransferase
MVVIPVQNKAEGKQVVSINEFVGVVLAGGKSSRMGQDKALLPYQGSTLLERAIAVLLAAGASEVVVSGREHPQGVPDLLAYCGPPGAILSLLSWLEQQQRLDAAPLVLIPVDMPLLTAATVSQLLASAEVGRGAYFSGEVFPCVLPASQALLSHLRALFATEQHLGGQRSLRALLKFCDAVEVPSTGIAVSEFSNVNTPAEWQAL